MIQIAPKILPDQAYLRQCFDYDPDKGVLIWRNRPESHFGAYGATRFNTLHAGKVAGNIVRAKIDPRFAVMIDGSSYYVHRIAWKLVTGEEPGEVDHKDRDGTNNKWDNLRNTNRTGNCQNRIKKRADGLPTGAHPHGNKFTSRIRANGVMRYIGIFDTADEAASAYRAEAARLHGEFVPDH